MLKFIAPLIALIGFVGISVGTTTDSSDSGLNFESTASALHGGSTAKGSVEF